MRRTTNVFLAIPIIIGLLYFQAWPTLAVSLNCLTPTQVKQEIQSIEDETNNQVSQIKSEYAAIAQQEQSNTNANLWASGIAGSGTAASQMSNTETGVISQESAAIADAYSNELNQENEIRNKVCGVEQNVQVQDNYLCSNGEVSYNNTCMAKSLYDIAYCRQKYGPSYTYYATTNVCVLAYCPPNSTMYQSGCWCDKGYVWNSS
ncbi:MAG TPA: hypothetical protein VMU70_01690 [Candidatus Tyrphobacter sp.]|nr:hypothetical protein [Candidatus Tyrphobacter sp.]